MSPIVSGGGGGGSQPVQRADIVVTPAQLLDLENTRVTVIAAPGPGLVLIPQILVAAITFGTAPYVVPSGEPTLGWDSPSDNAFLAGGSLAEILTQTADSVIRQAAFPDFDGFAYPLTNPAFAMEDRAILFYISNPLASLADGDGTLRISLIYSAIPVG